MGSYARRRSAAVAAVAILLAASLCAAPLFDDERSDDSDAVTAAVGFAAGFVIGAIVGGYADHVHMQKLMDDHDAEMREAIRSGEVNRLGAVSSTATADYENALSNYAQIWALTSEHWEREAELAASVLWAPGEEYDPERIMLQSGVYANSAMMLANSVAQPNVFYAALSGDFAEDVTGYGGKITASWNYGSGSLSGTSSWSGKEAWAADVPASASDGQKVYIADGGYLEVHARSVTVRGPDGPVTLSASTPREVPAGVYTLTADRTYTSDRMLPVLWDGAASIVPAMVMEADGQEKVALCDGTKVTVDGVSYDGLSFSFRASGGSSCTCDLSGLMEARCGMIDSVRATAERAESSSWAVWQIYGRAGHASAYLTTLAVPDEMGNVPITGVQKDILTVLSLRELASYYQSTNGQLLKSYTVSAGSNLCFVRGDILDQKGTVIAKDAVFTPYYMASDDSLSVGSNTQTQTSIAAVWQTGYTGNLSSWPGMTDEPSLITVQSGYVFDAAEIRYDGQSKDSVDFDVRGIDYIEPSEIDIDPNPNPGPYDGEDYTQIIMIAMALLAVLLAFSGITRGRPELLIIAAVAGAAGVMGAGTINDWIVDGFSLGGIL